MEFVWFTNPWIATLRIADCSSLLEVAMKKKTNTGWLIF
jgi:hypothetical protein